MIKVKFKPYLKYKQLCKDTDKFFELYSSGGHYLYEGLLGIYLSKEIDFHGEKLYFPFIDIDATGGETEDEKIRSAIVNAELFIRSLDKLNARRYFIFIATGGTGFRAMSNLLFNLDDYKSFVEFVKSEMTMIKDTQPTETLEMPYQIFAYKGHKNNNTKSLVGRSSKLVPAGLLKSDCFSEHDYKTLTSGKPYPNECIDFLVEFFDAFRPVTDLKSIGALGKKILKYRTSIQKFSFAPFKFINFINDNRKVPLETLQEWLLEKGIVSKIEIRGDKNAISFRNLPCPKCGKTTSNAYAYPPLYILKCFNTNCEANIQGKGSLLSDWSDLKNVNSTVATSNRTKNTGFKTIFEARKKIEETIKDKNVALIVATPGVGKTYVTLEYIVKNLADKTVVYSSFNKNLQKDSYRLGKKFAPKSNCLHLLEPRNELCEHKENLLKITDQGYSPAEFLCSRCDSKPNCLYFLQRKNKTTGIFFVTHHMLQYLENIIPNPDLIILDEDVVSGFLVKDECSEIQMRSLLKAAGQSEKYLVHGLLNMAKSIGYDVVQKNDHPIILNGKKMTGDETSIIHLLSLELQVEEPETYKKLKRLKNSFEEKRTEFFSKKISWNAVEWLKGLFAENRYSYIFIDKNGSVYFRRKYVTPLAFENTPVKILDATGNEKACSRLIDRPVKMVKVDVEWACKLTHFKMSTNRSIMKRRVFDASNKKGQNLKNLVRDFLDHISSDEILVVSYKFSLDKIVSYCQEIEPRKKFLGLHFHGPRGSNIYKECNAVLVVGLPYPNIDSSGQDTFILFDPDKDANLMANWINISMENELLQIIHRIRPVNKGNENPVEIVIASNILPSFLPPPTLVVDRSKNEDWKEIAIAKLKPFVKEFEFFNQDICFLANVRIHNKEKVERRFKRGFLDILRFLISSNMKGNSGKIENLEKEYGKILKHFNPEEISPNSNQGNLLYWAERLINVLRVLLYINWLYKPSQDVYGMSFQ